MPLNPALWAIDSIDESGWHGSCEGFPETWRLRGQEKTGDKYMTDTIETGVPIVGEGSAEQAAALTAREAAARVTLRPEQLGRRAPITKALVGDVAATIETLLPLLHERTAGRFLDQAIGHYVKTRKGLDDLAKATRGATLIHPQQITKTISDLADEDAVFTCDVGLPSVWAGRYLAMDGRRRLIGSFWRSSMANAMAQAIGAQAAFPGRQLNNTIHVVNS